MDEAKTKDLKTMQVYIRKSGVDIKGISDELSLHDPQIEIKVLNFIRDVDRKD